MLYVTSSGIGISTTTPSASLHVNGAIKIAGQQSLSNYGGNGLNIDFTSTNIGRIVSTKTTSGGSSLELHVYNSAGTDVTALAITSSGNVGIGTTSPVAPLQVNGNFRLYTTNGDSNELRGIFNVGGAADPLSLSMYKADATSVGIFLTADGSTYFNNGNVGIGTTSPNYRFHIVGTDAALDTASSMRFYINRTGTNVGSIIFTTGGPGTANGWAEIGQTDASGDLYFKANPSAGTFTNRMVIQGSSGNVGINTTSPASKLTIYEGDIRLFKNHIFAISDSATWKAHINFTDEVDRLGARITGERTAWDGAPMGLGFDTGAVNSVTRRMTITSGGNVGIGTTVPTSPLHVEKEGSGGDVEIAKFNGVGSNDRPYITLGTSVGSYQGMFIMYDQVNNTSRIDRHGGQAMSLTLLGNGGNVGIATTSPISKLAILQDTDTLGSGLSINSTNNYVNKSAIHINSTGTGTGAGITFENKNINTAWIGHRGGSSTALHFEQENGDFVFASGTYTQVTEHTAPAIVTFKKAGNVGIGSTSPSAKLDVAGTVRVTGAITSTSTAPISFQSNSNTGTYNQTVIYANQNNTSNNTANGIFIERGRLSDSPSAEIRSFVVGDRGGGIQLLLDKDGKLTVTNDVVAYGSPSDISLKTNIKPLENSLDKIMKLQGVSFTWKENTSESNLIGIKDDLGFIAQQVQEVLPDLVRKNDNGLLSLRDKGIIPVLVEAIKEQQRQIDELKYLLQTQNK
jgi:hypothetical protein